MKIAVIGWGSLIWNPRSLVMSGRWRKDGPMLPVEFARRSGKGRLTLVTHEASEAQRTYWVLSGLTVLDEARENLREREGTPHMADVHWATRTVLHASNDIIAGRVQSWLSEHAELEAAIWAGLKATVDREDVVAKAVEYLMSLMPHGEAYKNAHEYVVKAPFQIQTRVRKEMQARGWTDVALPDELFEK